jgi:hypothetical protein
MSSRRNAVLNLPETALGHERDMTLKMRSSRGTNFFSDNKIFNRCVDAEFADSFVLILRVVVQGKLPVLRVTARTFRAVRRR